MSKDSAKQQTPTTPSVVVDGTDKNRASQLSSVHRSQHSQTKILAIVLGVAIVAALLTFGGWALWHKQVPKLTTTKSKPPGPSAAFQHQLETTSTANVQAKAAGSTPTGTDYQEVLTFVAAAGF